MDKVEDDFSYESKHPIIMSPKHEIPTLIIQHFHNQNTHIGQETVISNLRRIYWITGCRNAVKKVAHNCQVCKNRKAIPQVPIMGQLSACRVNQTVRPFVKTGVDLFGPIEIKVHRSHEKRYGVIFTRATHLEIAQDLSNDAFINVLRQFGCRRGFPEEIYSDNGTNFRKTDKVIRQAIDSWTQDQITQFTTMRNCKWIFNPPAAPHMGGAWERLIQSVKKHLAFLLKERFPKEYVLRTLFCEIENMMNSRPLTHIPLNSDDASPLTPNDFLIGPAHLSLQFAQTTDRNLNLLNGWRAAQPLTDLFWARLNKEYRQHILFSRKGFKDGQRVSEGDVVLVMDPDGPRNVWPKGIIVRTYPSSDGRVRVVDVRTTTGIPRRPVAKIVKLEVSQ